MYVKEQRAKTNQDTVKVDCDTGTATDKMINGTGQSI